MSALPTVNDQALAVDKTIVEVKHMTQTGLELAPSSIRVLSEREATKRQYPKTGTGLRQGERLARQKANYQLDFSASNRCIAAINARLEKRREQNVA